MQPFAPPLTPTRYELRYYATDAPLRAAPAFGQRLALRYALVVDDFSDIFIASSPTRRFTYRCFRQLAPLYSCLLRYHAMAALSPMLLLAFLIEHTSYIRREIFSAFPSYYRMHPFPPPFILHISFTVLDITQNVRLIDDRHLHLKRLISCFAAARSFYDKRGFADFATYCHFRLILPLLLRRLTNMNALKAYF